MKYVKGLLSTTSNKLILSKREEDMRPYGDRHPNFPHFKPVITLRRGKGLGERCCPLLEVPYYMSHLLRLYKHGIFQSHKLVITYESST